MDEQETCNGNGDSEAEGLRSAVRGLVESVNATSRQLAEAAESFARETVRVMEGFISRLDHSAEETRDMAGLAGRAADEARRITDEARSSIGSSRDQLRADAEGIVAEVRAQLGDALRSLSESAAASHQAAQDAERRSRDASEKLERSLRASQEAAAAASTTAEAAKHSADNLEEAVAKARRQVRDEAARLSEDMDAHFQATVAASRDAARAAEEARAASLEAMTRATEAHPDAADRAPGAAYELLDRLEADYIMLTQLVQSLQGQVAGLSTSEEAAESTPVAAPVPSREVSMPADLEEAGTSHETQVAGQESADPASIWATTEVVPSTEPAPPPAPPASDSWVSPPSDMLPAFDDDRPIPSPTDEAPEWHTSAEVQPSPITQHLDAAFTEPRDTVEGASERPAFWVVQTAQPEDEHADSSTPEPQFTETSTLEMPQQVESEVPSEQPTSAWHWKPVESSETAGEQASVIPPDERKAREDDEQAEASGETTATSDAEPDGTRAAQEEAVLSGRVVVNISPVPDFDRLLSLDGALSRIEGIKTVTLADYAREEVTFRVELNDSIGANRFADELAQAGNQTMEVTSAAPGHLQLRIVKAGA